MKSLFTVLLVAAFAAPAFSAIEFSEDAMVDGATSSSNSGFTQPVGPRQNDGDGNRVPLFMADSSGGMMGMFGGMGGGFGGGAIGSSAGLGGNAGNAGGVGGGGQTTSPGGGGAGGPGVTNPNPTPVATPEPTAMAVWSLLACIGLAVARVRGRDC